MVPVVRTNSSIRNKLARHNVFYMEDLMDEGDGDDILDIQEWGLTELQQEKLEEGALEAIERFALQEKERPARAIDTDSHRERPAPPRDTVEYNRQHTDWSTHEQEALIRTPLIWYTDGSLDATRTKGGFAAVCTKEGVCSLALRGRIEHANMSSTTTEILAIAHVLATIPRCIELEFRTDSQATMDGWKKFIVNNKKLQHTEPNAIIWDHVKSIAEGRAGVTMTKVEAHSGDVWNDIADGLAKEAASRDGPTWKLAEMQSKEHRVVIKDEGAATLEGLPRLMKKKEANRVKKETHEVLRRRFDHERFKELADDWEAMSQLTLQLMADKKMRRALPPKQFGRWRAFMMAVHGAFAPSGIGDERTEQDCDLSRPCQHCSFDDRADAIYDSIARQCEKAIRETMHTLDNGNEPLSESDIDIIADRLVDTAPWKSIMGKNGIMDAAIQRVIEQSRLRGEAKRAVQCIMLYHGTVATRRHWAIHRKEHTIPNKLSGLRLPLAQRPATFSSPALNLIKAM